MTSTRETSAPQDAPTGVLGGPPMAEGPEPSRVIVLSEAPRAKEPTVFPEVDEGNVFLAEEDEEVLGDLYLLGKDDTYRKVAQVRGYDIDVMFHAQDRASAAIAEIGVALEQFASHLRSWTGSLGGLVNLTDWAALRDLLAPKTPAARRLRRYWARTQRVPRHQRLKPRHGRPRGHR